MFGVFAVLKKLLKPLAFVALRRSRPVFVKTTPRQTEKILRKRK